MQYSLYVVLSFWMLLATMPFSISMHYCKGLSEDFCSSEIKCCSSKIDQLAEEDFSKILCCSTDCCSELSITSLPKEQFKNNFSDYNKDLNIFIDFVKDIPISIFKQNSFITKTKQRPLLVENKCVLNQCFLC